MPKFSWLRFDLTRNEIVGSHSNRRQYILRKRRGERPLDCDDISILEMLNFGSRILFHKAVVSQVCMTANGDIGFVIDIQVGLPKNTIIYYNNYTFYRQTADNEAHER